MEIEPPFPRGEASRAISLWEYNGLIKEAIHRIKFNGEYAIVKDLINLSFQSRLSLLLPDLLLETSEITFVPMTKKAEKKRGFNQAEIIAKELGRWLNKPVIKLLDKVKETEDQAKLDRDGRLKNLKDCFQARRGNSNSDLPLLLVDDVYTTGATMQECGRALKKSGYKKIICFTLARTV